MKSSNKKNTQPVLEVNNLRMHFKVGSGKHKLIVPAVDDISFKINKGEVFGLVGESGCGKTTTGRTIIKLYKATDGSVHLNGKKIFQGLMTFDKEKKSLIKKRDREILLLKEHAEEYIEKVRELKKLKKVRKIQLNELKVQHEKDLKELNVEKNSYKRELFDIDNQLSFDYSSIEYRKIAHINRKEALLDTAVLKQLKRKRAKFVASYKRKKKGLKSSEALKKQEIKKRLVQLVQDFKVQLAELDAQIAEVKKNNKVIDGEQALTLKEFKEYKIRKNKEAKHDRLEAKKNAEEKKKGLNKVSLSTIAKKRIDLIKNYKKAVNDTNKEYNDNCKKINNEINQLKVLLSKEKTDKVKVKEINKRYKDLLADVEVRRKEAKVLNRNKRVSEELTKIQMIFQDPISSLNPRMTVQDIIAEGLIIKKYYYEKDENGNVKKHKYTKKILEEKVKQTLELVGLAPEYAARYPHEFSGGQRQRIGIARALIMKPDFIIADEPISALDVSIRAQVINLFHDLKLKLGLTILFIAHDLSVVRFFCDNIGVMFRGKILELAPTEDLFQNPLHPYTRSLLSAIPLPDPDYEKGRTRILYNPMTAHNYNFEKPALREVLRDHYVYCSESEYNKMREEYRENQIKKCKCKCHKNHVFKTDVDNKPTDEVIEENNTIISENIVNEEPVMNVFAQEERIQEQSIADNGINVESNVIESQAIPYEENSNDDVLSFDDQEQIFVDEYNVSEPLKERTEFVEEDKEEKQEQPQEPVVVEEVKEVVVENKETKEDKDAVVSSNKAKKQPKLSTRQQKKLDNPKEYTKKSSNKDKKYKTDGKLRKLQ